VFLRRGGFDGAAAFALAGVLALTAAIAGLATALAFAFILSLALVRMSLGFGAAGMMFLAALVGRSFVLLLSKSIGSGNHTSHHGSQDCLGKVSAIHLIFSSIILKPS